MPSSLYKLRRWTTETSTFFTCGRPGRKAGPRGAVHDEVVRKWINDVRTLGSRPAIVSPLGAKPDGMSEYSFYSFCGGFDSPDLTPTFTDWLAREANDVVLKQHPTIDFRPLTVETLSAIQADVEALLGEGRTLLIFDSGGETRTAQVCKHLGAKEAFPTTP